MELNVELSARLHQILTYPDCPVGVIGKLRELQVVEAADCAWLAAHAQDVGELPKLLKIGDVAPEERLRTKMIIRRIWSECREATTKSEPKKRTSCDPAVAKPL